MTFAGFSRPCGTCEMANLNPAVNCRAIFRSPSGSESFPALPAAVSRELGKIGGSVKGVLPKPKTCPDRGRSASAAGPRAANRSKIHMLFL